MLIKPKYRVLWTWDFGTCWDDSCYIHERGSTGCNSRRLAFLRDYKRLIDFASLHHYNGVVIWGALRAHDNGFDQLKELIKYGREKGVRVLPGVSAFSYGGVCYDPRQNREHSYGRNELPMSEHPYSLNTWLKKHPEYAALDKNGKPYDNGPLLAIACPSRIETQEWFKEGLEWLYDEFDVDGIQVEVGDYAVCHCSLCNERRKKQRISGDFSISDMISTYTLATDVSLKAKPDAWVICETYSSPANLIDKEDPNWRAWGSMVQKDRELLTALPKESILQWGVDHSIGGYACHSWDGGIFTPSKNNILRIHAGSQWAQNGPADWAVNLVWEMVKNARFNNLNGVSLFGEESAFAPPNEANYLALEEASGFGKDNPDINEALFYSQTLDPLYGGRGYAEAWRSLYIKASMLLLNEKLFDKDHSAQPLEVLTDDKSFREKALTIDDESRVKLIERYYNEARAVSKTLSGDCCYRWSWLENKLCNIRYIISTKKCLK